MYNIGSSFKEYDPTDISTIPEFNTDEWSTEAEIQIEDKRIQSILIQKQNQDDQGQGNAMDIEFGNCSLNIILYYIKYVS